MAATILAGCTRSDGNAQPANGAQPAVPAAQPSGPPQTDTLTGLYESGAGPRHAQLCMVQRDGSPTGFGLVTWGTGDANCSGSGVAVRDGARLQLQLDGDQNCTLEARIEGGRVTMPGEVPEACQRYYCGPGARLTGVQFDKTGGTEADAARARDLVGDPLCGG